MRDKHQIIVIWKDDNHGYFLFVKTAGIQSGDETGTEQIGRAHV